MYSKNYMKKIGSLALAGAMAASLSIPAFASSSTPSTQINTTYKAVTIDVTVPASGTAVINPYALPIDYALSENSTLGKKVTVENQQIATAPMAIRNNTKINLNVIPTVTTAIKSAGKNSSQLEFAETDTYVVKSDSKQVYVELQAAKSALQGYSISDDDIIYAVAKDATWTNAYSVSLDTDGAYLNDDKKPLITLAAVNTTAEDATNSKTDYAEGSIAYIRLYGKAASAPEDAWTASDGFTSTVAFTFTPVTSGS
jgi:hypothetical protein